MTSLAPARTLRRLAWLLVCCVPALAMAQAPAQDVWVVTRDTGQIHVIDTTTNMAGTTPFDISDPDGDGRVETPAGGLAFSTVPGFDSTHAFVTYEEGNLAVVEVATGNIVQDWDLAALLSGSTCHPSPVASVTPRGCDAAVPRRFLDPATGEVVRSYLHVAATVGAGESIAIVLEQRALISGGSPLVDCETLRLDSTALDVRVLENPHGPAWHRAWYTVRDNTTPELLESILVATGQMLPVALAVEERQTVTLPAGSPAPDVFRGVGAPLGREFPVWSRFSLGDLVNLDLGGSCSPAGDLRAVEITGVGPHSYEVWALEQGSGKLVLVDPIDCTTESVGVGTTPVDVAFLGRVHWGSAFVVNRGSDNVSRVDADKTVTTIPLVPCGPGCTLSPIAAGTTNLELCDIQILDVEQRDINPVNGVTDTIRVSWQFTGDCDEFLIECLCVDEGDPDCPCKCNCNETPDLCECPGFEIGAFAESQNDGIGDTLLPQVGGTGAPEDVWVPLGVTSDLEFNHPIQEGNDSEVWYDVKPNDE